VVNTLHLQRRYRIVLNDFTPVSTSAHFTVLSGAPGAKNSADNPYALMPIEYDAFYSRTNDTITLTFAPSSFTIVRLQ